MSNIDPKLPVEPQAPNGADASAPSSPETVVVAGVHSDDALRVGDLRPGDVKDPETPVKPPPRRFNFLDAFKPNRALSPHAMAILIAAEAILAVLAWNAAPSAILPSFAEIITALQRQWQQGAGQELATSFQLNVVALAWSSLIALGLSYLTVLPVFRPIVAALSKSRFLSLTGFSLIFTSVFLMTGRQVKVALMVMGITGFYITSMASVIATIPKEQFDHARTLRMGEWRVVWEVVILGTVDKAFEVLRQNAAIGWIMLTMVEGIVRSEGGLGVLLMTENKYFRLADMFALQLLIVIVGMMQDYFIGWLRRFLCPYADLTLERK